MGHDPLWVSCGVNTSQNGSCLRNEWLGQTYGETLDATNGQAHVYTHKFTWDVNGKLCLNFNIVISTEVIIPVQTVLSC